MDSELESLRSEKVLYVFNLNTGQDDHALMFLDDHLNQIERVVKRMEEKKQARPHYHLRFCRFYCSLLSPGGKVKDEHISVLINAGLLTYQLIDPNMYWFAIPNIGSILKDISQKRKKLLSFLNRRKYKEMMLAPLEKKRLRLTPLDMRFHIRDLIGHGKLKTIQTPTGLVVGVAKD